jgi:hypothetical protein
MLKKQYFLFIAIISLSFLTGCPGASDYDIEMPGNYSVIRTSAHNITIAPKTSEDSWGANIIPAKVTEVGWNDEYIIAKQINLEQDSKSNNGYEIPDTQDYHFWIIEIESGKVTGPLDDLGLIEKKKEYEITDDIILKSVQNLRE